MPMAARFGPTQLCIGNFDYHKRMASHEDDTAAASTSDHDKSTQIPDDPEKAKEAHQLAFDCINWHLSLREYEWEDCPDLPPPDRLRSCMRNATRKFNEDYDEVLNEMINRLNLESNTVYPSFVAVCKEIFKDGINWGRIVALFAFGGRLAVYCAEHSMDSRIVNIAQWVFVYITTELQPWLDDNNGWNGFCEFHERGSLSRGIDWRTFIAIGSVAVGTAAIAALKLAS